MVMSIRHLAARNGDQVGRLPISERLASALLSFVREHCLDSSYLKSLSDIADRLVRDVERSDDVLIAPSFIAFEQDASASQCARIGFSTSYKDLHMGSFIFAEVDWGR